MKKLDIVGQKFNRLLVLSESLERTNTGKVQFKCKCDCGNIIISIGSKLKSGWTKSCGCLQKETISGMSISNSTHKQSKTNLYTIWASMKARCYNKKYECYERYGGRGIVVCDEWKNSFENFKRDIGEKPGKDYSIDRIDFDGNYEPSNCKWSTRTEQENNKSTNRIIEHNGEKTTLAQLARKNRIEYRLLYSRIVKLKWDVNYAITKI